MWNHSSTWWVVMPLLMVLFWLAVIWVAISLTRGVAGRRSGEGRSGDQPDAILAQRYARDEIDEDEYRRCLDIIRAAERAGDRR